MRLLFTLSLMCLMAFQGLHAETVKLKITYKGSGISDHKVSVMIGGAVLGSGTTNSNGEVDISVSSLPSKHIDLKGEKTCNNGRKSWEVKGYVTLDGSNYAHLKMEDPISEMVEASGGFMSEGTLAASYGLVCAGGGSSSNSSGGSSDSSSDDGGSSSSSEELTLMTKEERLENQKMILENKISNLDRKIAKNKRKIAKEDTPQSKKNEAELDNNVYEVEKKLAEHKLLKVNKTIDNGGLSKSEKKAHKAKEEDIKTELDAAKSARKKGKVSNKETAAKEESDSYVYTEADMTSLSTIKLKQAKVRLKSALSKKKLSLKTKRKMMSPDKVKKLEGDVSTIEASLEVINTEINSRKNSGGEAAEESEEE